MARVNTCSWRLALVGDWLEESVMTCEVFLSMKWRIPFHPLNPSKPALGGVYGIIWQTSGRVNGYPGCQCLWYEEFHPLTLFCGTDSFFLDSYFV